MAGRGPAPKEPEKRARRNRDTTPKIELERKPAARSRRSSTKTDTSTTASTKKPKPPNLPARGPLDLPWPSRTVAWWKTWQESPQAEHFTSTDWDFLLDTAALHAALWGRGDTKAAAELRLRVAKFGATVEDRARLRMTFGEEPKPDPKTPATASPSREKYGRLRIVESATGA